MDTPLLDGILKTAIVGPLVDADNLAIPSGVGALIGNSVANARPEKHYKHKMSPGLMMLMPGYTGYHLARKSKAAQILRQLQENDANRQLLLELAAAQTQGQ